MYLDLTAGGFDWGPALGGEGVVTPASLPSAGDYFATVQVRGAGGCRQGQLRLAVMCTLLSTAFPVPGPRCC
jgi:hypothetical protein